MVAAPLDGDGESVPVINITERQRLEFSKARKPSDGPAMADGSSSVDASSEQARGGGGRTRVVLSTAVFEGRLRVSDEALFTRALLGGVGASKAHGCGLLTVVPVAGV